MGMSIVPMTGEVYRSRLLIVIEAMASSDSFVAIAYNIGNFLRRLALLRRKIVPYVDLIYYDIKIADPAAHAQHAGRSNKKIFENFRRLLREEEVEVHPRIPLIPGITSTSENLLAIVDFLCEAGARSVSLLPYNPMGIEMYARLGRTRPPLFAKFTERGKEKEIYAMFGTIIDERLKRGEAQIPLDT